MSEETARSSHKLSPHHWLWLGSLLLIIGAAAISLPFDADASRHETASIVTEPLLLPGSDSGNVVREQPATAVRTQTVTNDTTDKKQWLEVKVGRGDTLAAIFSRNKLSATDLHNIMALGKPTRQLRNLKPGQTIRLHRNAEQQLQGLVHVQSATRSLQVQRNESGFTATQLEREYEKRTAYGYGKINSSLFQAGQKSGLAESVIMDLASIFGWDIDFALDIRQGDEFRLVYEELYLDGEKIRDGDILAAEFINRNNSFQAVRYTDPSGRASYYTPDGLNMRKAFLRSPVDFRRISSRFGKRKHPVLNRMKLHRGVDYAAARGTPVRATGDGKIIHRARKGGYGKTVIIRHGSTYTTLYAHLNSYDRKARHGNRVKQGQVIGYVGSTGRSTGPHLHYEFRVHGAHRNPLTVKLPSAAPIAKKYKADFIDKTHNLIAQLDGLRRTQVALRDE